MNVSSFLNVHAEKIPNQSAIGFKKKDKWMEISWIAFRRLVYKTANALRDSGIEENDTVAIYSDNAAEWMVFDLAILSLGAVTVPIYASYNKEQAEYIIKDAECKIVLVGNQSQYDAVFDISGHYPTMQQIIVTKKSVWIKKENSQYLEDFIKDSKEEFEIVSQSDDDLATIIYTSGTTSVPKGAMITHGNFNKAFDAHFDYFKFKNFGNEVSLAFLPLTHVLERSWTLLALYGGAKVYFLENPKLIAKALVEVKPTMMCAVPRFYQKIYAAVFDQINDGSSAKKKIFSWAMNVGTQVAALHQNEKPISFGLQFKHAIASTLVFNKIKTKLGGRLWFMPCGGASLSPEVTKIFEAIGVHITVGYGLTETTATLTAQPFTHFEYGAAGLPFGDTQIKIGEAQEILAKGSGIMKGYFNNPDETAKVFTADGWFKTGDVGHIDERGNLFITDRIKDLMKTSNGKYIAPQPIENKLTDNNFIQQAMVIAEDRSFVSALIVPNFEALKLKLKELAVPFSSWAEVVKSDAVKNFYEAQIEEASKGLSDYETIKKFILLPEEFEIDKGEITPTLKIKRKVVMQRFAAEIDNLYGH